MSTLQNKLTLSFDEDSLTQNMRKNSNDLILDSNELINVIIVNDETSSQNKQKMFLSLISMFQFVDVQIIISRKKIRDMSKKFYEKF